LTNHFDPDALLTLDLACRYGIGERPDQLDQLEQWRTVPRVGDHELAVLWSRGLSDMHVHVGGIRIAQAAWLELMVDRLGTEVRGSLARIYRDQVRRFDRDTEDARFERDMEGARRARDELLRRVLRGAVPDPLPRVTSRKWWRWSVENLLQERRMLTAAWWHVVNGNYETGNVLKCLDIYLVHKHRFFHLVRQPAFVSAPGLRHFGERYFSLLRPATSRDKRLALWRSGNHRALKTRSSATLRHPYGQSTKIRMTPFGDACQYLLKS
jgi:hypothetical protein